MPGGYNVAIQDVAREETIGRLPHNEFRKLSTVVFVPFAFAGA